MYEVFTDYGNTLYINYRKQALATKEDAEKDGVHVPLTLQEYCVTFKPVDTSSNIDVVDFYDDDDYVGEMDDDDDDDDDDGDNYYDDDEDSGNGGESW